jgi:sec-independent protein translocase protein TatC
MARLQPDTMTFLEHLEELRQRLVRSALALVVGTAACWSFRERIFHIMTQPMRDAGFKAPSSTRAPPRR